MTERLVVTTHEDDLRIGDTDRLTSDEIVSELASNDDALRALAAEKLMLQNELAKMKTQLYVLQDVVRRFSVLSSSCLIISYRFSILITLRTANASTL